MKEELTKNKLQTLLIEALQEAKEQSTNQKTTKVRHIKPKKIEKRSKSE